MTVCLSLVLTNSKERNIELKLVLSWFQFPSACGTAARPRLPFPSPVWYSPHQTRHMVLSFILCLFLLSAHLAWYGKLRWSSPRIEFQPQHNAITCMNRVNSNGRNYHVILISCLVLPTLPRAVMMRDFSYSDSECFLLDIPCSMCVF